MMNMWKKKITKMLIVMNLILMPINNSYYMFNFSNLLLPYETNEAIPVMVKFKQIVMPLIELIQ